MVKVIGFTIQEIISLIIFSTFEIIILKSWLD